MMNHEPLHTNRPIRARMIWIVACVFLLSFAASSATAESSWVKKARKYFEEDEYTECIEVAEAHEDENLGVMFLAFSYLQEGLLNNTKAEKEKFKTYKKQLGGRVSVDDVANLLYFVNLSDKPEVVSEARKLSNKAFKNIVEIEQVPKLVTFLSSNDQESRKLALSSIKRILEPKRKYVSKGGTLRKKDIRVMGSKRLIIPLLERADEKEAQKALVLIEEPVLEYTGTYSGEAIMKLEGKVNKAVAKRREKYPESNWYSAVGIVRE
jgi:hypothetical protein